MRKIITANTMKYKIFILTGLLILFSCDAKFVYFNGKINIIEHSNAAPDSLQGEEIKLDGLFAGGMWAQDSLIGFIYDFSDYFMNVFNINTGKFLYSLCKRGESANEFLRLTYTEQFDTDDSLRMWIRKEAGRNECLLINMQQANDLCKQKMDINVNTKFQYTFSFVFILNDSLFLGNNQGEEPRSDRGAFVPPAYHLYNAVTKQKVQSYSLYNAFVPVHNTDQGLYMEYYYSMDRIKPDKSKLVMAMYLMDQINIFDLNTETLTGFRDKTAPDFDYLKHDPEHFRTYYHQVCVDDVYIYGLYSGKKYFDENNCDTDIINVFDWNGNFIRKLVLDKTVLNMAFDPVHKYLYVNTTGSADEEIYRYSMKYLY